MQRRKTSGKNKKGKILTRGAAGAIAAPPNTKQTNESLLDDEILPSAAAIIGKNALILIEELERYRVVALVLEVRPDDFLLGETEHSKSSAFDRVVLYHAGVCRQSLSFVHLEPDVTDVGTMDHLPAVRSAVFPADVQGILPEQLDLTLSVPGVPQCVTQDLTRSSV